MRIATLLASLLYSSALCVRFVSSQSEELDQVQSAIYYEEEVAVPPHISHDSSNDAVDEGELIDQQHEPEPPQLPASLHDHDMRQSPEPEEEEEHVKLPVSYSRESDVLSSIQDSEHEIILSSTRATLIKQQVKRVGLGVDQLKQILVELQEEENQRSENGFTSFEAADEDDDRTLLDIFGEAAKEYLTKKLVGEAFLYISSFRRQEPISHCNAVLDSRYGS